MATKYSPREVKFKSVLNIKTVCRLMLDAGADPGFGQGRAPDAEAESCQRSEGESCE